MGNGDGFVLGAEVFREGRLDFWAWTEVQKDLLHNVFERQNFSLGVRLEGWWRGGWWRF